MEEIVAARFAGALQTPLRFVAHENVADWSVAAAAGGREQIAKTGRPQGARRFQA